MKTVTTPQGKIMVDESAEIKRDDWHIDKGIIKQWYGNLYSNRLTSKKIIATINHSISLDVPMVIVEDEVEKSAGKYADMVSKDPLRWSHAKVGYKAGVEDTRQKGFYSEADLRIAIRMAMEKKEIVGRFAPVYTPNEIIESLNQEPTELEMEEVYEDETLASASGFTLKTKPVRTIYTQRVYGQLMAYLKHANPA